MDWMKYFEMMKDWKKLPAYRAEPRIDSLIGYYLPDFAGSFLGDKITGVIPELPIRLATVKPEHEGTNYAHRSYKVDFYLLGASGKNYFVEFKTDTRSLRDKQKQYLDEAKTKGMRLIVEGIFRIVEKDEGSPYEEKYKHLLSKLSRLGIIDENGTYSGKSDEIQVVFVQPSNKNKAERCIDFEWISGWLTTNYPGSEFEKHLGNALKDWAGD
jgi:hypothetical protein